MRLAEVYNNCHVAAFVSKVKLQEKSDASLCAFRYASCGKSKYINKGILRAKHRTKPTEVRPSDSISHFSKCPKQNLFTYK